MELYILDTAFLKSGVIDEFISAVWTEKFTEPGEFRLELPTTVANIDRFVPGTFVSLAGSKEVMIVETRLISKDKVTVAGRSLLSFLDERAYRISNDPNTTEHLYLSTTVAEVIYHIVTNSAISGYSSAIGGSLNNIPNLTIYMPTEAEMASDDIFYELPEQVVVPYGPVMETVKHVLSLVGGGSSRVGISLYLDSANASGYSLKFKLYLGNDRSFSGGPLPMIRFSEELNSFTDVEELVSYAEFKTIAYAFLSFVEEGWPPEGWPDPFPPGVYAIEEDLGLPPTFDRRVLMVTATPDDLLYPTETMPALGEAELLDRLSAVAGQKLGEYNTGKGLGTKIDGQFISRTLKYGVDFNLGDTVGVQGRTGIVLPMRIKEYIRIQDATGEREYPTLSRD